MAERLAELGMPIDPAEVLALARDGSAGRPHIAQVMVNRGYVASVREAFDRYLRAGGDRKSTRLNSSHSQISYAVFCLKKKTRQPPGRCWLGDSVRESHQPSAPSSHT